MIQALCVKMRWFSVWYLFGNITLLGRNFIGNIIAFVCYTFNITSDRFLCTYLNCSNKYSKRVIEPTSRALLIIHYNKYFENAFLIEYGHLNISFIVFFLPKSYLLNKLPKLTIFRQRNQLLQKSVLNRMLHILMWNQITVL